MEPFSIWFVNIEAYRVIWCNPTDELCFNSHLMPWDPMALFRFCSRDFRKEVSLKLLSAISLSGECLSEGIFLSLNSCLLLSSIQYHYSSPLKIYKLAEGWSWEDKKKMPIGLFIICLFQRCLHTDFFFVQRLFNYSSSWQFTNAFLYRLKN